MPRAAWLKACSGFLAHARKALRLDGAAVVQIPARLPLEWNCVVRDVDNVPPSLAIECCVMKFKGERERARRDPSDAIKPFNKSPLRGVLLMG